MGFPVAYRRGAGGSLSPPRGFQPPRPAPRPNQYPPGGPPRPANDNGPVPSPGTPSAGFGDRFWPLAELPLQFHPLGRSFLLLRDAIRALQSMSPNPNALIVEVPPGWTHVCGPAPVADGYTLGVIGLSASSFPNLCGLTGQAGPKLPGLGLNPPFRIRSISVQAYQFRWYGTYYQLIEGWNKPSGPEITHLPPWTVQRGYAPGRSPEFVPTPEPMPMPLPKPKPAVPGLAPGDPEAQPAPSPQQLPITSPYRRAPVHWPWRFIPLLPGLDPWWRDAGNTPPDERPAPHPTPGDGPGTDPSSPPVRRPAPGTRMPIPSAPGMPEAAVEPAPGLRPGDRIIFDGKGPPRFVEGRARLREPPGRRVRERKLNGRGALPSAMQRLWDAVGTFGEWLDFLDALHDALPKKFQAKGRGKRSDWTDLNVPGSKLWTPSGASPLDKLNALYNHLDAVDWYKAGANLLKNELGDRAGGYLGNKGKQMAQRTGGISPFRGPLH